MADEAKLERKLVKKVKQIGGIALKFVSPGCDGYPSVHEQGKHKR